MTNEQAEQNLFEGWAIVEIFGHQRYAWHCGVVIEECPHEPRKRYEDPCPCCGGSFWVAIVRGKIEKFRDYLESRA